MEKHLKVILTQTYNHKPLMIVNNFPGGDAELTPAELKTLASALLMAAADCELLPIDLKRGRWLHREYSLATQPLHDQANGPKDFSGSLVHGQEAG